jgi:bleomycin hydrolase
VVRRRAHHRAQRPDQDASTVAYLLESAASDGGRWNMFAALVAKHGKDGLHTMNDSWFGQYVFEIAARKSALPAGPQQARETEPIVLPAWDPMGALAR